MSGRLVALLLLGAAGCTLERPGCLADGDCAADELCFHDLRCLPRDVARRAGPIGTDCGDELPPCRAPGVCRAGLCFGEPPLPPPWRPPDAGTPGGDTTPPAFPGLTAAYPDGQGALLVYWAQASDDTTPRTAIEFLLHRATAPGGYDLARPVAVVKGRSHHDPGLEVGRTYYYAAQARDRAGNLTPLSAEISAEARALPDAPRAVDFATQVLPVLRMRCLICHGGAGGLYTDAHSSLMTGGTHGPAFKACYPEQSVLVQKTSPAPPFGSRMPRSGPPFLPIEEQLLLRQWIAEGALERFVEGACPPQQ